MATASLPESRADHCADRGPIPRQRRFAGSPWATALAGVPGLRAAKLAAGLTIVQSHHAWSGQLGKGVAGALHVRIGRTCRSWPTSTSPPPRPGEGSNCGALRVGQVRLSGDDQRAELFDALQTIAEHGFPTEAAADQRLLHAQQDRPAVGIVQGVRSEGLQHGHIADRLRVRP